MTPADWEDLPDDELLKLRVRDLGVRIEGTVLEERIARFHSELEARGIGFKPPCYLADEWLCPDKVPMIGIPFFLAHPRLIQLEKKMMLEAEGETEPWCLKLLRHESGHALNSAYRIYKRTRWRELFGPFTTEYYNVTYDAKPYSKRFVVHLEDNYAQAHPDEDWAETFAVWLAPGSDWQERYKDWPALKKLQYVDKVMKEFGPKPPVVTTLDPAWAADKMSVTLAGFYDRKKRYLGGEFPGFYDRGLMRIFSQQAPAGEGKRTAKQLKEIKAAQFLRRHRRNLVKVINAFIPQRKFDIDKLAHKLMARCEDLDLFVQKSETETLVELTAYITAIMASMRRFNGDHNRR